MKKPMILLALLPTLLLGATMMPEPELTVSAAYIAPEPTPKPADEPAAEPETEPETTAAEWPDDVLSTLDDPDGTAIPSLHDDGDAEILARIMYGEARGIADQAEQAAICWTVLNRVDAWGGTIRGQATAAGQFYYSAAFPTVDDHGRDLVKLAEDVIRRWELWHAGVDVERELPDGYLWYWGSGTHNYFRNAFAGGDVWRF